MRGLVLLSPPCMLHHPPARAWLPSRGRETHLAFRPSRCATGVRRFASLLPSSRLHSATSRSTQPCASTGVAFLFCPLPTRASFVIVREEDFIVCSFATRIVLLALGHQGPHHRTHHDSFIPITNLKCIQHLLNVGRNEQKEEWDVSIEFHSRM